MRRRVGCRRSRAPRISKTTNGASATNGDRNDSARVVQKLWSYCHVLLGSSRSVRGWAANEIFELQAGGYLRVLGASEGTVEVPGCAGLRLDLDALWAQVDRLA